MTRTRLPKEVVLGDTIYELDQSYRAGALAHRAGVPYHSNPHRDGSYAYDQWNNGHCHEDEDGAHVVDGVDVITGKSHNQEE